MMLDFLYQNAWGAFAVMLLFQVPFLIVFFYVVYRKAFIDQSPSGTDKKANKTLGRFVDNHRARVVRWF